LDEKTKAYVDGAFTKLRYLKKGVNQQYTKKNNRNGKTSKAWTNSKNWSATK